MKFVTGAALILVGVLLSGCFGEPAKGPADARVTITEYSDFECPYCARFVADTLPKIEANYGDKVLFVFRNYPLPANMHPYAEKAAEAGECANDQGRFWEYHDLLFQNQSQLAALVQGADGVQQVIDELKRYAASLNLDMTLFDQCLDLGQDVDKVTADHSALDDYARANGVDRVGTPSFLINDKFVTGAYPFDENSPGYQKGMFTFKAAIDEALANAQ